MVEATGVGIFLYRPVAWCFIRGMKSNKTCSVCGQVFETKNRFVRSICKECKIAKGKSEAKSKWAALKKKQRLALISFILSASIWIKTSTNLWRTEIEYGWGGSKKEIPYRFFKKHGTAIRYFEDGSTKIEEKWVYGTGTAVEHYEDGTESSETPFVNGKKHGTEISYRRDGSKWGEIPFVDGKEHGTQVLYNEDGSKKEETPWVQGKVNGTQIGYREDGSKAVETLYENGKEISRKEF